MPSKPILYLGGGEEEELDESIVSDFADVHYRPWVQLLSKQSNV